MNANDALALIEHMCDSNAEKWEDDARANLVEVDSIRSILVQVQPRYWLTPMVDSMVIAYKDGDMGAVHQIIQKMIFRDQMEQDGNRGLSHDAP